MTKDSRRSSVVGSTPLVQQQSDGESTSVATQQSLTQDDLEKGQETETLGSVAAEPLNTSVSATKDEDGDAPGPAIPYGTRSRNRNGASRINYAEDKEIDAEFEVPSVKETTGRRATRPVDSQSAGESTHQTANTRNSVASEQEASAMLQNPPKDPIPGTSTFSANMATAGSQPASKKRKITGQQGTSSVSTQMQQNTSTGGYASHAMNGNINSAPQLVPGFRETNMLGFENCGSNLKNNVLVADDGTRLEVNDHVYLVCEPPGEPYYLGRIMEFLHANNDPSQPIDALRLNWYYRPKDIGRVVNDTRQVFASMHSDISPLTSLRGKCQIKHKSEVNKLDDVRKAKDTFWYEKLYDRYIHRFYDVVPTSQVINVPDDVKRVLDERWRYIIVEPGRGKELTSAVKSCKRCNKYSASNDSVDCAVCRSTYHMSCVSPPLLKKPSRGFAWACGPCSKAQEKRLEARNTPNTSENVPEADEDQHEEEDDSPDGQTPPIDARSPSSVVSNDADTSFHPGTAEQIHQASLWLFRYLGIYCKVEDALDYDDRIYPRASSRLGPRHQAVVAPWYGHPVEYVKPVEIKKKFLKGAGKKDVKLSKDTVAALEADKVARENRPKWVMDEPNGYVARGEDYDNDDERNTAKLLYRHPESSEIPSVRDGGPELDETACDQLVFGYMTRAASLARSLGLPDLSTNLLDVALETLKAHDFDTEKALQALVDTDKKVFKEPELTPAELKKFEDGVSKFGSEWHSIKKHVKTLKPRDVVRFYYTWKKTNRGKQVWGNYSGRKNKKEAKRAEAAGGGRLQDDVADEHDDSAFDNDKAFQKKRGFQCKFCSTRSSRQWRRAPNTAAGTMIPENPGFKPTGKDKGPQLMVALCRRCAELWRRYAIQWEDVEDVAKQAGARTWKRKIDEEVLNELVAANEVANHPPGAGYAPVSAGGTPAPTVSSQPTAEVAKRKGKLVVENSNVDSVADPGAASKKKAIDKPTPALVPEIPKPKTLPCAICGELEPLGDQLLNCKECRMSVHRDCYGVMGEIRGLNKWMCDMCSNDKNPQVSIQYKCMLCPIEQTEHDFIEPIRLSTKKRSEKERERERVEREQNAKAAEFYQKRQEELNKPANPREPLKRTANNNWVHVTCAVFTPEVKFGNAKALEPSEGIPSIASARYDETCKVCKLAGGACVGCHTCRTPVHVECAHQAGYLLGFDISPVKGSRRDQVNVVNIKGEIGTMVAAIWCKDHIPTKTIVHHMHDIVGENGLNALQLYVQTFKQADLTLTGTVRKATLVNQSTKALNTTIAAHPQNRRASTNIVNGNSSGARAHGKLEETPKNGSTDDGNERSCATCGVHISPKWWPFPSPRPTVENNTSVALSIETGSEHNSHARPHSNGLNPVEQENVSIEHAALAAAALHQNPAKLETGSAQFQCHKCHWRKVEKAPSPPSAEISSVTSNVQLPDIHSRVSSTVATNTPPLDRGISHPPAHYTWPQPPSYPTNDAYSWRRPSPTIQGSSSSTHVNGHSSPHNNAVHINASHSNAPPMQGMNGQAHPRPTIPPVPHSPHQNGQLNHGLNGYPPSPHRIGSSTPLTNGSFPSLAASRPSIQHLTNGGPFARAPDPLSRADYPPINHSRPSSFGGAPTSPPIPRHPYHPVNEMSPVARPAHPPMRALQSEYPPMSMPRVTAPFNPALGSPPAPLNSRISSRDSNGAQHNERLADGRVNGGASASPSVRNLLS